MLNYIIDGDAFGVSIITGGQSEEDDCFSVFVSLGGERKILKKRNEVEKMEGFGRGGFWGVYL